MPPNNTIAALLAGLQTDPPPAGGGNQPKPQAKDGGGGDWHRKAARIAWVKQTVAALRDAQRAMDDRCTKAVEHLDEDAFHRLFEAEQARVRAIRAPLQAVVDEDRWPRALYFGGI